MDERLPVAVYDKEKKQERKTFDALPSVAEG
jgi:hypothetical protein